MAPSAVAFPSCPTIFTLVSSGDVVAESSPMSHEQCQRNERYHITRTGSWFVRQSKEMVKQGKTLQEIIQRLNDLKHVIRDWSKNLGQPMNLPSDEHPEFWDSEALEKYIAKRKLEWLKEPDSTDDI